MPSYFGLLHSLVFLGVISGPRLSSLHCIVCGMLRFAYAYGVPGWVVEAPGDDLEGVTELPCPPEPPRPPSTQVEGALSAIKESVQASPTQLEGKEASAKQSVEHPRLRRNLPWPLPQRRTPAPRSSSADNGARCRNATREMHLANWSVTSFSSMT